MERIITRNGDYLYTKEDVIDFLVTAGIDRYDCDAIGEIFNSAENVQAAKAELDSDLRCYEASLEHNRNIAEEIIWSIEEKLKMQRITGAREFLKTVSEKLEHIY